MGLVEEAGRDDVVAIRKRPSVLAYAVLVGFGVGLTVLVVSMVAGGDKPDHVAKPTVPSTSTSTTTRATRSTVTSVVSTPVTVTAADGTTVAVTNPELDGAEPVGAVNLRLLTGGWILDVDSGSRTFLAGLPGDDYEVSEILPAGRDALMVYRHTCGPAAACAGAETRVFVLPWNEISAQPIYDGPGVEVAPGIDRFWITEQHADDDCTLSAVDGVTSSARPLRCSLHIVEETPIGLWASDGEPPSDRAGSFTDDVLLDPDSGDELFRTPQIVAVSDGWVVSTDESRRSSRSSIPVQPTRCRCPRRPPSVSPISNESARRADSWRSPTSIPTAATSGYWTSRNAPGSTFPASPSGSRVCWPISGGLATAAS